MKTILFSKLVEQLLLIGMENRFGGFKLWESQWSITLMKTRHKASCIIMRAEQLCLLHTRLYSKGIIA